MIGIILSWLVLTLILRFGAHVPTAEALVYGLLGAVAVWVISMVFKKEVD